MCQTTHLLNGRYKIDNKILGEGEISKVLLGYDNFERRQVAIKQIDKSQLDAGRRLKLQSEIAVLKRISPYSHLFVQLYDVFEDEAFIYLVMELISGGELFELVEQFPYGLPEVLGKSIIKQIFTAIAQLHKLNIAHLDLKLENIMYCSNTERIRIVDFGFATSTDGTEKLKEFCGSVHYIAPQILNKIPYDGKKADVWSLGVIAFALLAARFPFDDDNQFQIIYQIKKGQFTTPAHFSTLAVSFVQTILNPHEGTRPTVEELLNHPFLQTEYE